jgi:hypothetical protein
MDVQSLARGYTKISVTALANIVQDGESESARVAACGMLLDRGWGKPPQPVTGKDGVEPIEVTIRTIIEGKK